MYKVIIVEDELIIQKGIHYKVDWLAFNCVVVATANHGLEAMQLIEEHRPDIVITDIKMPFMTGVELIEQTKQKYQYEAIIISGFNEFEYAKKAIQMGVTDFILKPIDFTELYNALQKITEKFQVSKEPSPKDWRQIQPLIEVPKIQATNRDLKYVQEMIHYIQAHFDEKISIQDLSHQMQISHTSLHTKFKKATNYTFNDFLNRYRIMKAIELMTEDHCLIYEVASKVGFLDYKYFSQVFKKYTGFSPSQFT